jgi:beta-galactosidase
MFRTSRLRAAAITTAAALVVGMVPLAAVPATAAPSVAGRPGVDAVAYSGQRDVDLTDDWRFVLVNPEAATDPTGRYAEAYRTDFDDSGWRRVDVPHDWSIELLPTAGPGTSAGTGFFQGGLGWYRKTFTLPRAVAGKRVAVEFDGVYMDSSVYVNGNLVGAHPYGYTGFSFDITPFAHADGVTPNVVAVQVRNQLPSSRWYSGSGIYRNVRLTVTDPVHVRRWGTVVTTPDLAVTLASGYGVVRVRTDLVNETAAPAAVTVTHRVRDARGRVVASATSEPAAAPGLPPGPGSTTVDIRLDRPHLWDVTDPYLYTLETALLIGRRTVDRYVTRFGVRHVRIDPAEGLFLNGRYTKIQGVDLHHDLGALGAATNRDALLRQMTIMKSMGVNALRTAHNPPSPELLAVCEELGIVMLVEAFDTWSAPKTTYDYARFFAEHSQADITEMVSAARNSPAVIMWSIGNEIRGQTFEIAERLVAAVKAADPTRPVVWGHDGYRSVPRDGSVNDRIARILDGVGLNYNTAVSVDGLHAKYPDKFFFESESSSSTSARGVYQEPNRLNTGENYAPGRRAVSSYDNNMASWTMPGEYGLKKDRDRRFFTGQFLWSGFDYIGEPTPYNVFPVKSAFFGAVDTAGFPKDLYYLFKSQWTTEPMVHLLPMNWTNHRPGDEVQVWAYSNVDTVELFLNGRSLGVRTFDHKTTADGRPYLETTEPTLDDRTVTGGPFPGSYTSPNGSAGKLHLTWNVPFAPGTLTAVARRDGRVVARDELRTAGAPHTLRLTPDRKTLRAGGDSLSYVTVEVVDANGVVVPDADDPVTFRVTGAGRLAGVDNGRQESAEGYQQPLRTAYNGKVLAIVRSTSDSGPVTFSASAPGLRPATTTLHSTGRSNDRGHSADQAADQAAGQAAGQAGAGVPAGGPALPVADASYAGRPDTLPAAMLDGDTVTGGWSNAFRKDATALLPAENRARPGDWVAIRWPRAQRSSTVRAYFATSAIHARPARVEVAYWNGRAFVPVRNLAIAWADADGAPTVITFDPVRTTELRLTMTSPLPDRPEGHLRITELEIIGPEPPPPDGAP